MDIKTRFVYDEKGNKELVIINYQDFLKMIEIIEDHEDLQVLLEAKNNHNPDDFVSLDDFMNEMGLSHEYLRNNENDTQEKKRDAS